MIHDHLIPFTQVRPTRRWTLAAVEVLPGQRRGCHAILPRFQEEHPAFCNRTVSERESACVGCGRFFCDEHFSRTTHCAWEHGRYDSYRLCQDCATLSPETISCLRTWRLVLQDRWE